MASARKGQDRVVAAIAISLLLSIGQAAFLNAIGRASESSLLGEGFGFLLLTLLAYFTCRGRNWARWTLGVLLVLNSLINLIAILAAVRTNEPVLTAWLVFRGILYAVSAFLLLTSADTKAFVVNQRSSR